MSSGRRVAGWLAIPAFLIALAMIGMAVTTEPKEEFAERARQQSEQSDGGTRPGERQVPSSDAGAGQPTDRAQPDPRPMSNPGAEAEADGDGEPGRQPIRIRTRNGDILIELDGDGNPLRAVPSDSAGPSDPSRILTPDPDGGFIGVRITEGGRLEPVGVGQLQDGDFPIRQQGGGIDITRPDGSRLRLNPSDDNGLSGTEIGLDGTPSNVAPDNGDFVIQPGDAAKRRADGTAPIDGNSQPILIQTEDGPVRIELQSDGDLVANQPGPDEGVAFDTEDLSAIRLDENGDLEVVPLDEVGPDDTILVPAGGGFDLVRPDGSRVEFRPDGENDGVTATEISPDGEARELTPNQDGSVTLDDGTTVGPIDIAEDGGPIEQLIDQTGDLPWPWVVAAIAMLAALSIGTAVYLHRHRPPPDFDYDGFAAVGVPDDQLEQFLTVLRADPDPTRSIRLAFYAVERGMAGLPARRVDETPFEWHSRVERVRPDLASALAPVCDLFALARFAPGQATVADRDLMVEHLRELNSVARSSEGHRPMAGV